MGKLFAALLVVLASVALWMTAVQRGLWFPENISTDGAMIDLQFDHTLVVTGAAFLAAQLGLAYAAWRYGRNEGRRVTHSRGSGRIEVSWTILTAAVFLTLAITGQRLWSRLQLTSAAYSPVSEDVVRIELVAQQFQFTFHYAGVDRTFGRAAPQFYEDSTGNYAGLDPGDAAGRDDLQLPVLIVPQDRLVELSMRSRDVIHNFFVPAMRIKQDIVPGMEIRVRFTATKQGRYEVPCAELCGSGHYKMKAFLIVVSHDEYIALERLDKPHFRARVEELSRP